MNAYETRTTMNGKPVYRLPVSTVLNLHSGFEEKLLCDGPAPALGDGCAYSCSFCYLPAAVAGMLLDAAGRDYDADDVMTRMIFGVSTGTFDDRLAAAFEEGTPLVSKRINSLHVLQDNGFRTYAMVCPSLPFASPSSY